MKIVIAGGHGQIAMLLHPILKLKGHHVKGIIRKPEQADALKKAGAEPVIADIEKDNDLSEAIGQSDAVVFAAGAGHGSGVERKWTVDRDGALKLIEAAKKNNIRRYVMISAMGLDIPRGDEVFQVYQKAKAEADEALKKSGLNYTIVKPGRLTNEEATGLVLMGERLKRGEIPREDVVTVVAEVLESPESAGFEFDLISGTVPVQKALKRLIS